MSIVGLPLGTHPGSTGGASVVVVVLVVVVLVVDVLEVVVVLVVDVVVGVVVLVVDVLVVVELVPGLEVVIVGAAPGGSWGTHATLTANSNGRAMADARRLRNMESPYGWIAGCNLGELTQR